jgi:hypothetical protein
MKTKWIYYTCAHTGEKFRWRLFTQKELKQNEQHAMNALSILSLSFFKK